MSPKPAPRPKDWKMEPCDNQDCDTGKHLYPRSGLRVRQKTAALRRVPGSSTEHLISSGEWGTVETHEPSFHEAIVNFRRGRKVWVDIDDLTTLEA